MSDKNVTGKRTYLPFGRAWLAAFFVVGLLLLITLAARNNNSNSREERKFADLDRNGRPETYVLKQHRVRVITSGHTIWQSPAKWKVDSMLLADATNDGRQELVLVVWKEGSFASHRPFWIKSNDKRMSNHLFIYDIAGGKIRPRWMSSAMTYPIKSLEIKDANHDGKNELVVIEKRSPWFAPFLDNDRDIQLWQWNTWGFYLLGKGETKKEYQS